MPLQRDPTRSTRLPWGAHGLLRDADELVVQKRGGGERVIPSNKWWVNRNTPVGEDAALWERMPHQGRRLIEWRHVLAVIRDSGPKPDGRDREDGLGAKPEGHGARQRNRPTLPSQTPAEESNND